MRCEAGSQISYRSCSQRDALPRAHLTAGFRAPQTHSSAIVGDLVHGILSGLSGAGAGRRSPSEWLHAPALQGGSAPQAVLVFIGKHVSILS